AEVASVGVGKLRSGLSALRGGVLALGAAGNGIQVIGSLTTAIGQLSGVALLLPAGLLAGAAAVGTLKAAFNGFGDAVNAKDLKAFKEATKDMAPAAAQTAGAVRTLKEEFKGVAKAVQGRVFGGLVDEVKSLGSTY